jgi:adenosylcobalamin-dependent ribonucleoside-triphosphate reductase
MHSSWDTPARVYAPGIGDAVADRTVNRKLDPTTRQELPAWTEKGADPRPFAREVWADVAKRVALGNTGLRDQDAPFEFEPLHHHLRQASLLMSGRHLQHGDLHQSTRNQEVFTNCSTAAASFLEFYLLLNGSGVGRSYDDAMMLVDWRKMPKVRACLRPDHPDVVSGEIADPNDESYGDYVHMHVMHVEDSREGWAKAVEKIEFMTWLGVHRDDVLLIDFSDVRPRGAPIGGMQNRPASGPGPLIEAIRKTAKLRDAGMEPWEATMHADHYYAECVLVGGARRAARMATKSWRDKSVLRFIDIKKGGVLWSSNNSITVDEEFWEGVRNVKRFVDAGHTRIVATDLEWHAFKVFQATTKASYFHKTGEPGFINVDKLTQKNEGVEMLFDGQFAGSKRFQLEPETEMLTMALASVFAKLPFSMIVNPCGEIPLSLLGGYCVIADTVPYHAQPVWGPSWRSTEQWHAAWDHEAEAAFRTGARALIRTNTMDCLYHKEVQRTNRIGVGFTGIFEYAWARFGFGWKDLVDEQRSLAFWQTMSRFSNAAVDEARSYSAKLGVAMPHTVTTVKPAGTTSKLFGLTEGAHLPSMRKYLRWVQFRNDDPLIEQYAAKGYPIKRLKTYSGTTVVGFPTVPEICKLGMGDALVTAGEATPEEQYEWLRLLEKYWLNGYEDTVRGGDICVGGHGCAGQVSYTLKYKPELVSFEDFQRTLLEGQSSIKCCSVMPQTDTSAYEYQPEEPISDEDFDALVARINDPEMKQSIGFEHVDCASGACPIDFLGSEAA